jgi:hypothetical protein
MNVRYVNYKICKEDGRYSIGGNNIISLNKYVELDSSFNSIRTFFTTEEETKENSNNCQYIGIEDLKLFYFGNKTYFIGTDYNHSIQQLGISYGIYDAMLTQKIHLRQHFIETKCEKNWTFTTLNGNLYIIYKWFPLTICKIEENEIIPVMTKEMPPFFSMIRGSTCEAIDSKTNEKWFICHFVSYETPRRYYHIFVSFDEDFHNLKYSAPFKFENEAIEYCLSIIIENEEIIINYSTWDKTTQIGIYDKKYIQSFTGETPVRPPP